MQIIKHDLGSSVEYIRLVPLGDTHIGDAACDYKLLDNTIEDVRLDPNAFLLLNGDIINNAIKNSVSDIYEETMTPEEQIEYAVELLMPIKDKILLALPGNHENRTKKDTSIDPMKYIMGMLGKLDVYTRDGAVLFLSFGKNKGRDNIRHTVSLYPVHGSRGGGRTASFKHVEDLAQIVDTDIYIHSHTHKPGSFRKSYFNTDKRYKTVQRTDKLFVNTASIMNYGGYGQRATYAPTSKNTPHIEIWYDRVDDKETVQFRALV